MFYHLFRNFSIITCTYASVINYRPKWDEKTTAEELQANERQEFLNWRRELNLFQEESNLIITPYEKNLDFWRQLWRVVERRY